MEDTSVTKAEISDTFGKPVAELVDGVSKLDKIEFQSAEDAQAENFRKMLLAMARDVGRLQVAEAGFVKDRDCSHLGGSLIPTPRSGRYAATESSRAA